MGRAWMPRSCAKRVWPMARRMIKTIINTFANCFKIPELKSRILFTLLMLGICRVIAMIPIPGLDGAQLTAFFKEHASKTNTGGGLLDMYSMFTGGALER